MLIVFTVLLRKRQPSPSQQLLSSQMLVYVVLPERGGAVYRDRKVGRDTITYKLKADKLKAELRAENRRVLMKVI